MFFWIDGNSKFGQLIMRVNRGGGTMIRQVKNHGDGVQCGYNDPGR